MPKKRLDHDDRINLQAGIAKGYSLKKIVEISGRSLPTIYRVIIKNCYYKTIDILVVIVILIVTINYLIIEMGSHFITYI